MSYLNDEPVRVEIQDRLIEALDLSLRRHSNDEETFIECVLCGKWEEHTDECPMPKIQEWMDHDPKIQTEEWMKS